MFKWSNSDLIVIPLTTLTIIVLAIIWRLITNGAKPVIRTLPLKILAVIVPLLEVSKQIYYNCFEEFTLYVLPLHFCSLFFILIPLSQFGLKKVTAIFKPVTVVFAALVTILVYVNPFAIIGESSSAFSASFHNAHTFLYHFSVIAYLIFSVTSGDYVPEYRHCINAVCGIFVYASYTLPFAYILDVNYVNILRSEFAPLEIFRQTAGQIAYNIVLLTISAFTVCLLTIAFRLIYKAALRSKDESGEENICGGYIENSV